MPRFVFNADVLAHKIDVVQFLNALKAVQRLNEILFLNERLDSLFYRFDKRHRVFFRFPGLQLSQLLRYLGELFMHLSFLLLLLDQRILLLR